MNTKIINALLWIAVLPGAILSSVIGYWFMYYSNEFISNEHSAYVKYVVPMMSSFISGVAFIYGGQYIAPSYKVWVSFVLMILLILLSGAAVFMYLKNEEYLLLIRNLIGAAGAITSYVNIKKENDE